MHADKRSRREESPAVPLRVAALTRYRGQLIMLRWRDRCGGIMKVLRRRFSRWVIASILLLAGRSEAHHSFAVFDGDKTVEIRGVIVDFKLRNPHSSLVVDGLVFIDGVPQGRGADRWEIEADATAPMRTSGIDESTFSVGDPIAILANPHKQRALFARARSLSAANGKEYLLGFRGSDRIYSPTLQRMLEREPALVASVSNDRFGVARIAGRWQQPLSGRSDGSVLPLNVAGAEAREAYDPTDSPANTCEPINMPELLHAPFFLLEIEVAEDRAIFKHELYDIVRTVPLGERAEAADTDGRFGLITGKVVEGNQLIVNSRDYPASKWGLGIATQPLGGGADVPSSDQKTVTERYSVSDDGQTLSVEYTLEDPAYLERPHHGRVELTRVPDSTAVYPYQCDPESAAMWSRGAGDAPLRVGGQ